MTCEMFSNRPIRFLLFYLIAAGCCYSMTVPIADPTSSQTLTVGTSPAPQVAQNADPTSQPKVRRVTTSSDDAIKPLFDAVESNNPQAVQDAINNGSYINGRNAFGFTPLHLAAALGHLEAMSVLLTAKADTEVTNNAGDRPLHVAAEYGRGRAAALLILAGADAHSFGQGGLTPLLRASSHNSTFALLQTLSALNVQRDNDTSDEATKELWTAVKSNDPEAAREAIYNGADIDWRNSTWFNSTPLHLAAYFGIDEAMSVLLRAGADKELVDSNNFRPIHLAAYWEHGGAVALLAVAGADIHSRGGDGRTPLQLAVRFMRTSTVALLRSLGG